MGSSSTEDGGQKLYHAVHSVLIPFRAIWALDVQSPLMKHPTYGLKD